VVLQQANLQNIEAQEKVGTVAPLVVAQAESELASTQVSLNQAKANVTNDRSELAFLLDAPVENNPLRDDYEPPMQVAEMKSWIALAESGRQDLQADSAAVKAARENVEVAVGQYYPTLGVNLNYNLYDEALGGGGAWSGLFSVNAPIFTGGLIEANVRSAWSAFRSAALTERELRRQIDQTVQTAYVNLLLARQQLEELKTEVKAAHDAYYFSEAQYKAGTQIYLNVLTAQNTLLSTQLQLTEQQFNQKTAYFNLLRTVGEMNLASGLSTTRPMEEELRKLATQPATRPL
jgi:outer membrane protein TolC